MKAGTIQYNEILDPHGIAPRSRGEREPAVRRTRRSRVGGWQARGQERRQRRCRPQQAWRRPAARAPKPTAIRTAVGRVLNDPTYAENVAALRSELLSYDPMARDRGVVTDATEDAAGADPRSAGDERAV